MLYRSTYYNTYPTKIIVIYGNLYINKCAVVYITVYSKQEKIGHLIQNKIMKKNPILEYLLSTSGNYKHCEVCSFLWSVTRFAYTVTKPEVSLRTTRFE